MEVTVFDTDPETGQKRQITAERFGGRWTFKHKVGRRGETRPGPEPTRAVWEAILETMESRCQRRQGVSSQDVDSVKRLLAAFQDAPTSD